jgi:hypothetical protein
MAERIDFNAKNVASSFLKEFPQVPRNRVEVSPESGSLLVIADTVAEAEKLAKTFPDEFMEYDVRVTDNKSYGEHKYPPNVSDPSTCGFNC